MAGTLTLEALNTSTRDLLRRPGARLVAAGVADTVAYGRTQDGLFVLAAFILQIYLLYRVWRFGGRLAWAVLLVQVGIALALVAEIVTATSTGGGATAFVVTQSVSAGVTLWALLSGNVRRRLQPVRFFRGRSGTTGDDLL